MSLDKTIQIIKEELVLKGFTSKNNVIFRHPERFNQIRFSRRKGFIYIESLNGSTIHEDINLKIHLSINTALDAIDYSFNLPRSIHLVNRYNDKQLYLPSIYGYVTIQQVKELHKETTDILNQLSN